MQNRSENTYQKINTIFFRDNNNVIMPYAGFVQPEFEYLRNCKWEATEKIDGTNMRIEVKQYPTYEDGTQNINGVKFSVEIKGKTDTADIPKNLKEFMEANYPKEKVFDALGIKEQIPIEEWELYNWLSYDSIPSKYTVYGEGYGLKIQKGGNYIKDGVGFIVFDVKVNEIYLKTDVYRSIAEKLGTPTVPNMGLMTIDEAIEFVKKGFKSTIAQNKDYDAEGLVLKTPLGLKDRMGRRLIVKIKTCDFRKYYNKYHTYDKVEQTRNMNY